HVAQQYTGVDGEIVHALLGLLDQGIAEDLPVQILGYSTDLFQRLVDGHSTYRHRRVADDPLPGLVDIPAGGQVHDGVGAPAGGPGHLLHLLLDGGTQRRVADIAVDLHQEIAADDHRLQLRVIDVGRQNGTPPGDLLADELGRDLARNSGAETVPRMLVLQQPCFPGLSQLHVLADGDELHLRRDDAA